MEPFIQKGFGSTLYRLEITFPLTGIADSIPENTKGLGQSELEFPLNPMLAGLRYRRENISYGALNLGFAFSAWANISMPGDKMMDTDWFGARSTSGITTSSVLIKFSQTQSRAELAWYGTEAGVDFGDFTLFSKAARYGLVVRMEHFGYRLYGVEGWQKVPGEIAVTLDTLQEREVLTYRLLRIMPRMYLELRLMESRLLVWNAFFSGAPAFAMDHDDHLLRKKESDTFSFGFEGGASSELSIHLSEHYQAVATGEFAYLRSKGKMDQRFYGDDPFTPNIDESGILIKDVVTRIIGMSGCVSAGVRYLF